jgi:Mn2+/Fe2+ NRAMP family transporter
VGTAVLVGARTSYRLSWVALLVAPLLYVVLAIAAQVGATTGTDLQSLALTRYGRRAAGVLLASVVGVNVVTIAADLQAGAAGIGLLTSTDPRWLVLPFGAGLVGLLLVGKYSHVEAVLRWLIPGFVAFTVTAILAHADWHHVLLASLVPAISMRSGELAGALALLGTTLTSYVYVWETVQRGTEEPTATPPDGRVRRAKVGAAASAAFTAMILWSMLVASAATLGRYHRSATSAADAARVLRPLAGDLAGDLFAAGLVVSAAVALPVLVASTAYVVGAHFDWRRGLSQPVGQARRFYAVLVTPIALAVVVSAAGAPVLGTLAVASVIGGLGTPLGLVILMRLATNRQVMHGQPISARLAVAGWIVVIAVASLAIAFLLDLLLRAA